MKQKVIYILSLIALSSVINAGVIREEKKVSN